MDHYTKFWCRSAYRSYLNYLIQSEALLNVKLKHVFFSEMKNLLDSPSGFEKIKAVFDSTSRYISVSGASDGLNEMFDIRMYYLSNALSFIKHASSENQNSSLSYFEDLQ